jgi:hypothetical protein
MPPRDLASPEGPFTLSLLAGAWDRLAIAFPQRHGPRPRECGGVRRPPGAERSPVLSVLVRFCALFLYSLEEVINYRRTSAR